MTSSWRDKAGIDLVGMDVNRISIFSFIDDIGWVTRVRLVVK